MDSGRHLCLQNLVEKVQLHQVAEVLGPCRHLVEVEVALLLAHLVVAPLSVSTALLGWHHHDLVPSVASDHSLPDSVPFRSCQLNATGLRTCGFVLSLQDSEAYASRSNAK